MRACLMSERAGECVCVYVCVCVCVCDNEALVRKAPNSNGTRICYRGRSVFTSTYYLLTAALTHPFTGPLPLSSHSLTHSLIPPTLLFTCIATKLCFKRYSFSARTHSLTPPHLPLSSHALTHALTHSLTHPPPSSPASPPSFASSGTPSVPALTHSRLLTPFIFHALTHSLIHPHSSPCRSCIPSPVPHALTHSLTHPTPLLTCIATKLCFKRYSFSALMQMSSMSSQ